MTQENLAANIDAEVPASATLLRFLLMLVAGWLRRQQAATVDSLKAENRMLREGLFRDFVKREGFRSGRGCGGVRFKNTAPSFSATTKTSAMC